MRPTCKRILAMRRDYAGTATQRERRVRKRETESVTERERERGGTHLAMQIALFSLQIMSFTMAETMANMVKELEHVLCELSTALQMQH